MSFYTDSRPGIFPGQTNNVMNGLCERISIQTTKVFDACMNQSQIDNYSLTLSNFNPANPTAPLTFVSGNSVGSSATVTNLIITRFDDKPKHNMLNRHKIIIHRFCLFFCFLKRLV